MDEIRRRFIEQLAALLAESGMPRMAARAYVCVLVDDAGQLTAAELADRLQASPAAISGAVRYCVQVGLLVRGREPGTRRDSYGLGADDPWAGAVLRREPMLARWEATMSDGARLFGTDRPAGRRLHDSQRFLAFLREELPQLLERWNARKDAG